MAGPQGVALAGTEEGGDLSSVHWMDKKWQRPSLPARVLSDCGRIPSLRYEMPQDPGARDLVSAAADERNALEELSLL